MYTKTETIQCGFELTDIDWSNQNVSKIVEFFSRRFDVQDKEIALCEDEIVQQGDIIAQLQGKVKQLEEEVLQGKLHGHGGKKTRRYNTRNARASIQKVVPIIPVRTTFPLYSR